MTKEILRLILSEKDKAKLELAKFQREERVRQYQDDYDREVSAREIDEPEAYGLTNEERNK